MNAPGLDQLAALRGEIEQIARGTGQVPADLTESPQAISYSLRIGGIFPSTEQKIIAIVESIQQTLAKIAPLAHFQTTVDGFTAKTVVNYSGFAASVWSSGTTAKLVDAHLESLNQAYAFRAAVTAVIAAVGNAIIAISIAVANPLTVWHAINSAEALKSAVDRLAAVVAAPSSVLS